MRGRAPPPAGHQVTMATAGGGAGERAGAHPRPALQPSGPPAYLRPLTPGNPPSQPAFSFSLSQARGGGPGVPRTVLGLVSVLRGKLCQGEKPPPAGVRGEPAPSPAGLWLHMETGRLSERVLGETIFPLQV